MNLGRLIQEARKSRDLTARELMEQTGLDVSPSLVSLWESGQRIPNPEHLRILCEFLQLDLKTAFMFWAQAQMPTKQLKGLFQPSDRFDPTHPLKSGSPEPTSYPASVTITLQKRDIPWFTEHPEAGVLLTRCLMAGLKDTACSIDHLTQDLDIYRAQSLQLIDTLKGLGYIIEQIPEHYRTPLGIKYIYRPDTPEFDPLRKARMKYIFDRILKTTGMNEERENNGYLKMFGKTLSPRQIEYFSDALEGIFNELIDIEPEASNQSLPYYLVVALGRENAVN